MSRKRRNIVNNQAKYINVKHNYKKQIILKHAAEVFSRTGYLATTIDDIADNLSATKGNIYYYFRSKADIVYELHQLSFADLEKKWGKYNVGNSINPKEKLKKAITAHIEHVITNIQRHKIVIEVIALDFKSFNPEYREQMVLIRRNYESKITTIIDTIPSEFKRSTTLSSKLQAKLLIASMNSINLWFHLVKDRSKRKITESLVNMFYNLICISDDTCK